MAYGRGMSRLYAERGREQAGERREYDKQLRRAEDARRIQDERKAGWSMFGKAVGSIFGPAGTVIGDIAGKTIGDLGTVGGRQAESYGIDMDVGKFGVSKAYDYAEADRALKAADKGEFWQDVTGTGKSLLTLYYLAQSGGSGNGVGPAGGDGSGMFFEDIPTFNPFETNPVSVT